MSERIKRIMGLCLLILSIAGIYFWEGWGRENFTTNAIIVLKEDTPAHTIISEDMVKVQHRDINNLIKNPITDIDDIIGKMSKSYIAGNAALSEYYFEDSDMIPDENEYIFQMPKSWIKSCPSTLRRSDDAYLYPVLEKEVVEVEYEISPNDTTLPEVDNALLYDRVALDGEKNSKEAELVEDSEIQKNDAVLGEESNSSNNEILEINQILTDDDIKPIRCLKIAFVKNQSNQEVQSVEKESRINGTSSVATVELIATFDDIALLESYRKNGYQFMILYK